VSSLTIDGSFSLVLWPLSLFVSELLAICLTFIELSFGWFVQSYISNNFRAPTRPYMIYSLNNTTQIKRVRGSHRKEDVLFLTSNMLQDCVLVLYLGLDTSFIKLHHWYDTTRSDIKGIDLAMNHKFWHLLYGLLTYKFAYTLSSISTNASRKLL
jgi:hypothetical protein